MDQFRGFTAPREANRNGGAKETFSERTDAAPAFGMRALERRFGWGLVPGAFESAGEPDRTPNALRPSMPSFGRASVSASDGKQNGLDESLAFLPGSCS